MEKCRENTKNIDRAENFYAGMPACTVGAFTLEDMIKNRLEFINIADVRAYNEYLEGHIPYAVHIPSDDADKRIKLLDKSKVTIVYAENDGCAEAYKSARALSAEKYPCAVLRGGFKSWKRNNLEIDI